MTDNEIIKALERCNNPILTCEGCPLERVGSCLNVIKVYTLDLINRQRAEIKRLKDHNKQLRYDIKSIKAEAVKEFAEKIHAEIEQALKNNYKVRAERLNKINLETCDEFMSYCDGKIAALRGIDDFIEETVEKALERSNP